MAVGGGRQMPVLVLRSFFIMPLPASSGKATFYPVDWSPDQNHNMQGWYKLPQVVF